MLKRVCEFIKENIAAIITVATAILTVVYAVLRLCIYVYWRGYFARLDIDVSRMNINFDKSIFAVILIAVILFVVFLFMTWVYEIIKDIKNKVKLLDKIKAFGKGMFFSWGILFVINVPLIIFLLSVVGTSITFINMLSLFILLYVIEMLIIVMMMVTLKQSKNKEKITEDEIAIKVMSILVVMLIILASIFYVGGHTIDNRKSVQLVENEEYMISYCDGEHFVLHKVKFEKDEITIYRNEQKIVGIENCEYSIKRVKKVVVEN